MLQRQWVHVPEEDTADTIVFRSAGTPLTPSRGRWGFELRPGGRAEVTSVGRGDMPETTAASWQLSGSDADQLDLHLETGEGHRWQIVDVEADRLELRSA